MCSQYLTNCASFAHSDCAISFSWCGKMRSLLPEGFAGLRGLPEREVERALLALVDFDARARVELFEALLRELAVLWEARHAEVDVAVRFVCVALFDKLLDDVDDGVDFVRRARVDGRAADAERVGVGVVFGDVFLRELGDGDAHLVRAVYHLVVDVGEVLHVGDFVAHALKVAAEDVEEHEGPRVADVEEVVDGRAADVEAHLAGLDGDEGFFFPSKIVVDC